MSVLLFDYNLSPRLPQLLAVRYPGSVHVRSVGLAQSDDLAVWSYAQEHGYTIVTKDDDFRQLCFLYGAPPKVIWVKLGNCITGDVVTLLMQRQAAIAGFIADAEASLLILWRDRPIEG